MNRPCSLFAAALTCTLAACAPGTGSDLEDDLAEEVGEDDSELSAFDWTTPAPVGNLHPTLATVGDKTFALSMTATQTLLVKQNADGTFGPGAAIPYVGQLYQPKLAGFGGYLYLAFTTQSPVAGSISLMRYDVATGVWQPPSATTLRSNYAPNMVVFNGELVLANCALEDSSMFIARMDASGQLFGPEKVHTRPEVKIEKCGLPPAIAASGTRLTLAWAEHAGTRILTTDRDGASAWSPAATVPGGLNGDVQRGYPSLAWYGGYLHLLHTAPDTQNAVWWSYRTPATPWSSMVTLAAPSLGYAPGLSATPLGLTTIYPSTSSSVRSTYRLPKQGAPWGIDSGFDQLSP